MQTFLENTLGEQRFVQRDVDVNLFIDDDRGLSIKRSTKEKYLESFEQDVREVLEKDLKSVLDKKLKWDVDGAGIISILT